MLNCYTYQTSTGIKERSALGALLPRNTDGAPPRRQRSRFSSKQIVRAQLTSEIVKEIISLVVHHDERGEIDDFDLADGFHAQFFEVHEVNLLDI